MSSFIGVIAYIVFFLTLVAAWLTHVVWWIKLVMAEELDTWGEWLLAIFGTIAYPIGCIHGVVLWVT